MDTGAIDPHSDVLLVVDVQNNFCAGGALAVPGGEDIVGLINRLGRRFANVVLTQDWHPAGHSSFASTHEGKAPFETTTMPYGPQILWPDHCVQGTNGAAFHADLDIPHAALVVRKGFRPDIDSYSAFFENDQRTATALGGYLLERRLSRVYLCGLATDFCVHFSALDARRQGFEAILIEDACRAIDLEGSLAAARTAMKGAGVTIIQSEGILG